MENTFSLDVVQLDYIIRAAFALVILSIIYRIFWVKTLDELSLDEQVMCTLKIAGYGLLGYFIYCNANCMESINVLHYFTFLLAVFETAHNIMLSWSIYIGALLRMGIDEASIQI
ncbi:hypothetical protein ACKXGF_05175 [Alkalibacillus sp. S2W]|uniref:hypothetical protein n=1 Tax=Alkalibacillus sp. S2W TaxID=3386553 RepID=UPI00398D628D